MTPFSLGVGDYAAMYIARFSPAPGTDVLDLEDSIVNWLSTAGMTHVLGRTFGIATEVDRHLAKAAPEPLPAPEPAQPPARPAAQQVPDVSAMSVYEYARHRESLGVGQPDVMSFLSGGR